MTYSQKEQEIVQVMAAGMRNSGRTCDDTNWDTVLAAEAIKALRASGYEIRVKQCGC